MVTKYPLHTFKKIQTKRVLHTRVQPRMLNNFQSVTFTYILDVVTLFYFKFFKTHHAFRNFDCLRYVISGIYKLFEILALLRAIQIETVWYRKI
jgi:hypothetical protein